MAKFCEESIQWTDLIDIFQDIYDKSSDLETLEVLQAIALARELNDDIQDFLDKLKAISLKGIICEVLSNYDIDEQISMVTDKIDELFSKLTDFDDAIASINGSDYDSLQDIEDAVKPILDSFISDKEDVKKLIDDQLKKLFEPLTQLGASEDDIDSAFEDVEFNSSPVDYITDIFFKIADKTLRHLK